jgi:hypothetical protein
LSRRSSPPRTVDVSIHWRVLLPWVSHSARDLILIGLSPFLLRILAEACGVWRRALP